MIPNLRRPWHRLAGCTWLPRLVDKTRLHLTVGLPADYVFPFCHPQATDGAFLQHFQLTKTAMLEAVKVQGDDTAVATWFLGCAAVNEASIQAWNHLSFRLGSSGYPVHRGFRFQLARLYGGTVPDARIDTVFALLAWDEGYWEEWLREIKHDS